MCRPIKSRLLALAVAASLGLASNPTRVEAASPPDQPRQQTLAASPSAGETRRDDKTGPMFDAWRERCPIFLALLRPRTVSLTTRTA